MTKLRTDSTPPAEILLPFAQRTFRRKVTVAEIEPIVQMVETANRTVSEQVM